MLLFLGEHALSSGPLTLTEQTIGIAVFNRPPEYDTSTDTIARVQVSVLRKKLREYFAYEGAAEPVIIDIPSGTYVPEFRRRNPTETVAPIAAEASTPVEPAAQQDWRKPTAIGVGVVLVAGLVVVAWILKTPSIDPDLAAGDGLWRPLFSDKRELPVVVSDANLMIFADMLGRDVTLHEYRHTTYPASLLELLPVNGPREQARHILGNYYTGIPDARVANSFSRFGAHYSAPVSIVGAREFRMTPGAPGNLVLVGNNRGNPYMELVEPDMNFYYQWPETSKVPAIMNRRPLSGEKASYSVAWQEHGYCVVSLRPKPGGNGMALIVLGSDLSSLDAGARFVTQAKWLRELSAKLGVQPTDPFPFFEALLETQLLASSSPDFRLIAFRKSN